MGTVKKYFYLYSFPTSIREEESYISRILLIKANPNPIQIEERLTNVCKRYLTTLSDEIKIEELGTEKYNNLIATAPKDAYSTVMVVRKYTIHSTELDSEVPVKVYCIDNKIYIAEVAFRNELSGKSDVFLPYVIPTVKGVCPMPVWDYLLNKWKRNFKVEDN